MPRELATIEGLPGLEAALAKKVEQLRAASVAAVADEVETIKSDAIEASPNDTDFLDDHISAEAQGTEGTIASQARYSRFVEFGTFKDAAQPFMRPAAEKARKRFPARAAAILKAALGG